MNKGLGFTVAAVVIGILCLLALWASPAYARSGGSSVQSGSNIMLQDEHHLYLWSGGDQVHRIQKQNMKVDKRAYLSRD